MRTSMRLQLEPWGAHVCGYLVMVEVMHRRTSTSHNISLEIISRVCSC